MEYNSDYSVRLATLGALGGDTTKCYLSVYDIDLAILDAIEHGGGGGGMDYNQIKAALAASGVTEILFIGNGSGETVTLDYNLVSQIGQGGGGGVQVVGDLSEITNPKEGMVAKLIRKTSTTVYEGIRVKCDSISTPMTQVLVNGVGIAWYIKSCSIGNGYDTLPTNPYFRKTNKIAFNNVITFSGNTPSFATFDIYPLNNGDVVTINSNEHIYVMETLPATTLDVYEWVGDFVYSEDNEKWLWKTTHVDERTNEERITLFNDVMYYGAFPTLLKLNNNSYDVFECTGHNYGGGTVAKFTALITNSNEPVIKMLDLNSNGTYTIKSDYVPLNWDKTKQNLKNNGVEQIKFTSGSTSAITLDYNLVSQIGQGGGGDYLCVDSIEALSGITSPKDGMIAYVSAHDTLEERKVIIWDGYGSNSGHIYIDFGNGETYTFDTSDNSRNLSFNQNAHYPNGSDFKSYDDRGELPLNFTFVNGATGTLVAYEEGGEYETNGDYKFTMWLDKHNGSYPTVTLDNEGNTWVESGNTTENVTVHYKEKGFYKYYADVNKWLAYDIFIDNYNATELNTTLQDYYDYRKPLCAYFMKDSNGRAYRKGFAGGTYETSEPRINFTTPIDRNDYGYWKSYSLMYIKTSGSWIKYNDIDENTFVNESDIKERLAQKIYTTSQNTGGLDTGGLYNVGVDETVSGVTISSTISFDATSTAENHIASIYNRDSGRGNWITLSEDGLLFPVHGGISASTNADWFVFDYCSKWDGTLNKEVTAIAAAKIEDNGDNTFTVTFFMNNDTWDGSEWYDNRGYTDYYQFDADNDRGYTWTVTEHQTLTVTPHLYTQIRFEHGDNSNSRMLHKYL